MYDVSIQNGSYSIEFEFSVIIDYIDSSLSVESDVLDIFSV